MRPVLRREQMRAFEARAIESGVPGIVLMENAGRGAAHLIGLKLRPRLEQRPASSLGRGVFGSCVRCADEKSLEGGRVLVVCGSGNNAGDGFVVGRHLLARAAGVSVASCVPIDELRGDAARAARAFQAVGGRIQEISAAQQLEELVRQADLIVDALFGTGLTRQVAGLFADVIDRLNASGKYIVSLDLPSGLDADSGRVHGVAIRADHTVAFAHLKAGLLTTAGTEHGGRLTVSHIGVPAELPPEWTADAYLLEESDLLPELIGRSPSAHKRNVGHVGVVGGAAGMVGAARLSGLASLRAGAGLATLVSTSAVIDRLEGQVLELMTARFPDAASDAEMNAPASEVLAPFDALVIGPGLGRDDSARVRARAALRVRKPTVLDADGLRAFEGRLEELRQHDSLILTPHPGEAACLLGQSVEQIENDRFLAVRQLAERTGAIVVLKGPRTLVTAPGEPVLISAFGTPALATGGTGDVLAGLIAGLVAMSVRRHEAQVDALLRKSWLGVALHGLAAEAWSVKGGDGGLVASDLLGEVPRVVQRLTAAPVG